jgi:5-formyltetrahydrofolate cyclo-ligase
VNPGKAAVREAMRQRRAALTPEELLAAGAAVAVRLGELPCFAAARTVSCYLSLQREIPTGDVLAACRAAGKRICVPAAVGPRRAPEPVSYAWAELKAGEALVAGPMQVPQPAQVRPVEAAGVDLVVVPGLAFDHSGWRIGYGGGHYDRLLAACRPDSVRVALAFEWQILDSVPHGPSDRRVDWLLTPACAHRCTSAAP